MGARARTAGDEGSTLITVLIVMLVLTVGGLALSVVLVNTTGMLATSSDRARVQAAVDAGVAAQIAQLESGELACAATSREDVAVHDETEPTYDFTLACGGGVATLEVRASLGGATAARQSVMSYETTPPPPAREPALVTRSPLDLNALTIKSVDPAVPSTVWVVPEPGNSGDFRCDAGGAIAGSVFLPAGTVFGAGGCEVKGDVYAERNVTIGSGTKIRGDLVSLTGNVTITGGNTIDGSIYAKGDVTGSGLSNRFVESIHAVGNLNLAGGTPVARDRITYGGTFTRAANPPHDSWAANSVTKTIVNPPPLPESPQWEGITQSELDALVASGMFTRVAWTGACSYSWYPEHEMINKIKNFTSPTLVDARHCSRLDLAQYSGTTTFKTDVIFVAPSFNIQAQTFASGNGDEHKLWFISPEVEGRNCASVPPVNIQGVRMTPGSGASKVSGMIFTQCTVHFANAGEDWKGSIHAGKMTGQPNFWYQPVGFPGRDASSGEGGSGGTGSPTLQNLTVVSNRDIP